MPDYTAWFGSADVIKVLKSLQVWPAASDLSPDGTLLVTLFTEQAGISADAIKDDIETITGRKPLLATRAIVPHSQTEPGGRLLLKVPARTIYGVNIGGTYAGLVITGGSAIASTTYWAEPSEYSVTGQPIESIQFSSNYAPGFSYAFPNQILVDALFGSYLTIPPALWRVGLRYATLDTLASIQGYPDVAAWSEDGFSEASDQVGPIDDKTKLSLWQEQYERTVKRFVRVVC